MSIKKISTFLLLGSLFIVFNESSAQKLAELTPPSPVAYELGRYGQTPVGLFSGTINSAIPLYEYRTKNLSVPISLNYSSNGIKVDELGTNVGLGWSLSVGGVITRIVRDLPDEIQNEYLPDEIIHRPGGTRSPEALTYFNNAGNNPSFDSETDLYMFNFNGHSGKFVYDNDHKIVMIPKQDIKIEPIVLSSTSDGYKITTSDGVAYTFLQKESTRNKPSGGGSSVADYYLSAWYLSTITHPNGDVITFVYEAAGYDYVTSQQEALISTPMQRGCQNEILAAHHDIAPIISYNLSVRGVRLKEIHSNIPEEGKVLITSSVTHPENNGFYLISNIQTVNQANQEIERFDFTYLMTPNKRVFLQKIAMKDPGKNYQFTYDDPTNFPLRLSFAQDHWGYYNGENGNFHLFPNLTDPKYATPDMVVAYMLKYGIAANKEVNSSYTSKGLLSRITYPTKGYSNFTYEPNTYRGTRTILPPFISMPVSVDANSTNTSKPWEAKSTTAIGFDQEAELKLWIGLSGDANCTGPDAIHHKATLTITDLTSPGSPPIVYQKTEFSNYTLGSGGIITLDLGVNYDNCYVKLLAGHSYQIKIQALWSCVAASSSLNYYQGSKSDVPDNLTTGGVRVKKVESYDGINAVPQIMRYYYGKKESTDVSTGEKGVVPTYLNTTIENLICQLNVTIPLTHFEISSSSLNALYNSMGVNTLGYNFVTVSNGGDSFENGGEEHEFILDGDTPSNNIVGDYIPSAPWSNVGFQNGTEKTVKIFKKSGTAITVLKTQSNTYVQDSRYHEDVFGYMVQKKYDNLTTSSAQYTCTTSDVTRTWTHNYCFTNHMHDWALLPFLEPHCIAFGHDNDPVVTQDRCYGLPVGTVLTNPNVIENLNVAKYTYVSNWEYLSSTVSTIYDLNGANPVTTTQNFFYDNPVHLQLTRTETNNGGNILKEKIYYPDDVSSITSLPGGDLQPAQLSAITLLNKDNQYRINTPIQTESYLGTIKRNTVRTIYQTYNGLTLPSAVKTLRGDVSSTNVFRDRVYYNAYDTKGNVLEALQTNDIFTSYIWGYNGLAPIAIAKNARANEIFFNGFEEPTPSAWEGSLTAYDATRSYTGKYSGRIDKPTAGELTSMSNNTLIVPARPAGKLIKYKYSCWVYSTGPSVDLFFFMRKANETGYFTAVTNVTTSVTNKWVYLEGEYDVADYITQLNIRLDNNGGGSVWFDDVRLYPSVAQMSTFTFQPLIGITSETLPNQQTKKYEYDSYNRLKLIRNGENAILQRSQYKYK